MLRRVVVLCFVLLLGLVVIGILPGCEDFQGEEIINCLGSNFGPDDWFGRPPLTVCMRAEVDTFGVSSWDFGDGASDTGGSVTHTYTEVGEYEVALDVLYPNSGKLVTVTTIVRVVSEPIAAFTYEMVPPRPSVTSWIAQLLPWLYPDEPDEEPEESLEIKFDSTSSYPTDTSEMYRPAQVQWSFGDGTQETVSVGALSRWSFGWFTPSSKMTIHHEYPMAGTYVVTLTLTDNLGYSDSISQTITVGTPGGDDDDDEVEIHDFAVGTISWEPGDEEEDEGDCVFVDGTVQNNASVAAGVEVTATAYGGGGVPVGTFTYWPAGATNIGVGVNYAYGFFLCDLSIPGSQVVTVEVVVTDAAVY